MCLPGLTWKPPVLCGSLKKLNQRDEEVLVYTGQQKDPEALFLADGCCQLCGNSWLASHSSGHLVLGICSRPLTVGASLLVGILLPGV